MLQLDRFVAAEEIFEKTAKLYLAVDGISGFILTEQDDWATENPGGPVFAALYQDRQKVDKLRLAGKLPKSVASEFDKIEIELRQMDFKAASKHVYVNDPMQPGDSISGNFRDAGTLGARVKGPGSGDYFITCGHVVEGKNASDTEVYQPGKLDKVYGDKPRVVGKVVKSPHLKNVNDCALVKLDDKFRIFDRPHDTPRPQKGSPAVGMLAAASPDIAAYVHIEKALTDCGAKMDYTTKMTMKDKDKLVSGTGKASGEVEGKITGCFTTTIDGFKYPISGFLTSKIRGGISGDSGTVAVIQRDQTHTVTDLSGATATSARDRDSYHEYFPGSAPEVEKMISGDGSGFSQKGKKLRKKDGKNILSRIAARLRGLGELEVVVNAPGYENPCKKRVTTRSRPTPVKEFILRPDSEVDLPSILPEEQPDATEDSSTCCTFGEKPYVTVSGDDSEVLEFDLAVTGTASIHVRFEVKQRVVSAQFVRHGRCYQSICGDETMTGMVSLYRTSVFEISGTAGEIELPVIGPINAGKISFKKNSIRTVHKRFNLRCSET